jgi:hypothetical protein
MINEVLTESLAWKQILTPKIVGKAIPKNEILFSSFSPNHLSRRHRNPHRKTL